MSMGVPNVLTIHKGASGIMKSFFDFQGPSSEYNYYFMVDSMGVDPYQINRFIYDTNREDEFLSASRQLANSTDFLLKLFSEYHGDTDGSLIRSRYNSYIKNMIEMVTSKESGGSNLRQKVINLTNKTIPLLDFSSSSSQGTFTLPGVGYKIGHFKIPSASDTTAYPSPTKEIRLLLDDTELGNYAQVSLFACDGSDPTMSDCYGIGLVDGLDPTDRSTPIKYTVLSAPQSGEANIFFIATNADYNNSSSSKSFSIKFLPFEAGSIQAQDLITDPFSAFEISYTTTATGGLLNDFENTVGGQSIKERVEPLKGLDTIGYDASRGCNRSKFEYGLVDVNGANWKPVEEKEYCVQLQKPRITFKYAYCHATGGFNGVQVKYSFAKTQAYGQFSVDVVRFNEGNPAPQVNSNSASYYQPVGTSNHNETTVTSDSGGNYDYGYYTIAAPDGGIIEAVRIYNCKSACAEAAENPGQNVSCQ